jgi:acetyltransferase-like isoleucine patch superfamily enzyme
MRNLPYLHALIHRFTLVLRFSPALIGGLLWRVFLGSVGWLTRISPYAEFSGNLREIHVGSSTMIGSHARFEAGDCGRITLGSNCEIHPYAVLISGGGNIDVGDFCSINPYSILYGHGGLVIGRGVRIAAHVVIVASSHIVAKTSLPIMDQGVEGKPVRIHDNVWIGAGVRILGGVEILSGAVIGAGAVVTADVPENAVVAGVPAKIIRFRRES